MKWLLSPSVNIAMGVVIIYLLSTNYKFLVTYFLMGPMSALLILSCQENSVELKKLDGTSYLMAYCLSFVLISCFWINSLIGHTRVSFFPEGEEKLNV